MDNIEVINFVERFRHSSQVSLPSSDFPARTSNSTISRLLCEEARYRWFGVVEEEDVIIDDISCVIIEINSLEPASSQAFDLMQEERNVKNFKSINRIIDSPNLVDVSLEIGENDANKPKAVRRDFKRGSTAVTEGEDE